MYNYHYSPFDEDGRWYDFLREMGYRVPTVPEYDEYEYNEYMYECEKAGGYEG